MKFYLDTVSLAEIEEIDRLGILDGIAVNASLVTEQGLDFYEGVREICRCVDGPITVGVLSIEEEAIVKEGRELAKIDKNIMVKCPLTPEGIKATRRLSAEGIRVNVSLCFSPTQALMAAKAGAWCVSLCLDRSGAGENHGHDDVRQGVTRQVVAVFRTYGFSTQVLLTDIRNPHEVLEAALVGGHICTMRFSVFRQLFD